MFKKRGIISIVTFSLVLLILFSIGLFSYLFYDYAFTQLNEKKVQEELLNSAGSFRFELINTYTHKNSTLHYQNDLDKNIEYVLTGSTISARKHTQQEYITENISTLGPSFCSTYDFYPNYGGNFSFNGTCISFITS